MKREWAPLFSAVCNAKRMRKLPDNTCRLLFPLLVTQCDQHGRIADDVDAIWAACWATFGVSCSIEETVRALQALEDVGLVQRHAIEGVTWLQIPDWEEKAGKLGERLKRGESKFPAPTLDSLTPKSRQVADSLAPKSNTDKRRGEKREKRAEESRADAREAPPAVEVEVWAKVFAEFESLDIPDVRAAYRDLVAMRKRKRYGEWEPETLRSNLRDALTYGPLALAAAFRESTRHEYRGIFPGKHAPRGRAHNNEPTFGDLLDAARAKAASA